MNSDSVLKGPLLNNTLPISLLKALLYSNAFLDILNDDYQYDGIKVHSKTKYEARCESEAHGDDQLVSNIRCVPQTSEVQNHRGRLTKCGRARVNLVAFDTGSHTRHKTVILDCITVLLLECIIVCLYICLIVLSCVLCFCLTELQCLCVFLAVLQCLCVS